MKRLLFIFLIFPLFLHAEWEQLFSENQNPALFHHVNVITGNLDLYLEDTIVEGATPIPLFRTYSSSGALERSPTNEDLTLKDLRGGWLIQGGWNFLPHANLLLEPRYSCKDYKASLPEPNGGCITYVYSHRDGDHVIFLKPLETPDQNTAALSARTNPKNNLLCIRLKHSEAILYLPNGGTRIYKGRRLHRKTDYVTKYFYRLESEILPNKHQIKYGYNSKQRLTSITTTNPSGNKKFAEVSIDLERIQTPFKFRVNTSDGKSLSYIAMEHEERDYIQKVESNCRPLEELCYAPGRNRIGARLTRFYLGGNEQFDAAYYTPPDKKTERKWDNDPKSKDFSADKVKVLVAPVGPGGERLTIGTFSYAPNYTDVRDVDNLLTRYHHDKGNLTWVEHFNNKDQLASLLGFHWKDGRLRAKMYVNEKRETLFAKTFHYDGKGNVSEEALWGNLTGNAAQSFSFNDDGSLSNAESYWKKYTYHPHFNVPLVEEEENGFTYRYAYKDGTDLIIHKFTCDRENILIREFFLYNEDNILVQEITDDGLSENIYDLSRVTERHIKHYEIHPDKGLPLSVTETYVDFPSGREVQLKKIRYSYCPNFRACAEEIYDANDKYRYTIHTDYDTKGHLTAKSTPLGKKNTYLYDPFGNLIETKEVGSGVKRVCYDLASRPITSEENGKLTRNTYDAKGRLITQTDFKGGITTNTYDCFGHCIKTTFPLVEDENGNPYSPTIELEYDIQGNLIKTISPRGEITKTFYNTLRKPIRIIHADGTEIHHRYNKNGTLAKTIYPDRTEIHYTYDIFQRMTSKKCVLDGTALSQETWTYNAFHLLYYSDPSGLITSFTYNGAGEKISEQAGNRQTTYHYDSLGNLERTSQGEVSHVEMHDIEGKVISQWDEDSSQKIENHTTFFYNPDNRKEKAVRLTSQGEATDLFSYDAEGRLILHTDPHKETTAFIFNENFYNRLNQRVTEKRTIDPLKNSTVEIYDALNRIVEIQKRCPLDKVLSKEEFFFDRSGNKSKRISHIYLEDKLLKSVAVTWQYDARGRLIKENEADQKTTTLTYNLKGLLSTRTLPSGITFTYSYDGLDRLIELKSGDGKVHYQYIYERGNDPIEIHDLVQNTLLKRSYNLFGELVDEINPLGVHLKWDYDEIGRCSSLVLPDASSLKYAYKGSHLSSIYRLNKNGETLYKHQYTKFDETGKVAEHSHIFDLGTTEIAHDLLERPTHSLSPWIQQSHSYGPSGLVMDVQNTLTGNKLYTYDPLNQLTQEGEDHYTFDSMGNRAEYEVNPCNQVLQTPLSTLTYDPDGNPKEKITSGKAVQYTYDPLGRLTSILYPNTKKIEYSYDPLSRLLAKQVFLFKNKQWIPENKVLYLYDQEIEIGTLDAKGTILELKVVGLGIKGDIGAAVAIELNNKIYLPLHDFSGHIIALITQTGKIEEFYKINAFGQEVTTSSLNPWRFASKRSDEGLIFFGLRFYDPSLGRWLTPDPSGFADGPNLYAYVHNSPLNRLDLFGLDASDIFGINFRFEAVQGPQMPIFTGSTNSLHNILHLKAYCNGVETDCFVFSKKCHQFQFTPEELNTGKVKIIEKICDMAPKEGRCIAASTFVNGIGTSPEEALEMGESIFSSIHENQVLVCLYSKTQGLWKDGWSFSDEAGGIDTPESINTRQFLVAFATELNKINPNLLISLIAHSRGGSTVYRAIDGMNQEQKEYMKMHLLYFGVAPATPLPKHYAYETVNIWSKRDYITKGISKHYREDPNFNIQIIPCLSSWREKNGGFADHKFLGTTYKNAVKDYTSYLKNEFGFHDYQIK